MKHSKIASIILSQIFLLVTLEWVQADDINYPNYDVDDLLEMYPQLPPLDIIPGKSLITPSTSIGDLEKDLDILNNLFKIVSGEALDMVQMNVIFNLARQYAFLRVLKYKDLNTTNVIIKRQLGRYLQLGDLILSGEDNKKVVEITLEGITIVRKYFNQFENEIINGLSITVERDAVLQTLWKSMSESAGKEMKAVLDKYLKTRDDFAKKYGKILGLKDSLSFWNYYNDYDFLSTSELKRFWNAELRHPYQKLMNYMRKEFTDLYHNYTNMEEDDLIPAYIFDLILHTHASAIYDYNQSIASKQVNRRFDSLWANSRSKDYNLRTMAEKAEEFFESLGFPKLKPSFWKRSVFENVGDNAQHRVTLLYEEKNSNNEVYALDVRASATFPGYQRILRTLFDCHRRQLMVKAGLPRILWDSESNIFQEAFSKAVMMCATSVRRLTGLGFMKKDISDEDTIEWFKGTSVAVFTGLAFSISSHTWRSDMIEKNIGPKNRLAEYWNRRKKYELVVPKTHAPEDVDTHDLFDIFSGGRILRDEYSLGFFAGTIIQYQIFARLCEIAGYYNPKKPLKPLDTCDFSDNANVAEIIRTVLVNGALKPWREHFDYIMGKPNSSVSAKGLLNYFAPLFSIMGNEKKEAKGKGHQ